jgi:hypothetical protein
MGMDAFRCLGLVLIEIAVMDRRSSNCPSCHKDVLFEVSEACLDVKITTEIFRDLFLWTTALLPSCTRCEGQLGSSFSI